MPIKYEVKPVLEHLYLMEVNMRRNFGGTYCLHSQGEWSVRLTREKGKGRLLIGSGKKTDGKQEAHDYSVPRL
jgi:hypothetical protein